MTKRYIWAYIVYMIISSFFIDIEHHNLLLHILNIAPILFLFYGYLQHCSKPFSIENYLVLLPLTIFPISEAIIYIFTTDPKEPLITLLNGIYFFAVHICFVFIYRMEGGRIITFTKTDYFQIFPIAIATFLVFGFVFLPIIPRDFIFLTMLIASMLAILLAHIINRPITGKSYWYALSGGGLIATTDFLVGYSTFFLCEPQFYVYDRFTYYLGLLCLIQSLLVRKQAFALNSQEEFFTEHK